MVLKPLFAAPSQAKVKVIEGCAGDLAELYGKLDPYFGNRCRNSLSSTLLDSNAPVYQKDFAKYILQNYTENHIRNRILCKDSTEHRYNKILEKVDANATNLEMLYMFMTDPDRRNIFVEGVANDYNEETLAVSLMKYADEKGKKKKNR